MDGDHIRTNGDGQGGDDHNNNNRSNIHRDENSGYPRGQRPVIVNEDLIAGRSEAQVQCSEDAFHDVAIVRPLSRRTVPVPLPFLDHDDGLQFDPGWLNVNMTDGSSPHTQCTEAVRDEMNRRLQLENWRFREQCLCENCAARQYSFLARPCNHLLCADCIIAGRICGKCRKRIAELNRACLPGAY